MNAAERTRAGTGSGAGLLVLLATLAVAGWWLAEPLGRVESRFYDALQKLQAGPGSASVALLELESDWWTHPRIGELAAELARLEPSVVLPASPVPAATQLPDLERLAALVELEQRSRTPGSPMAQDAVAAQLDRIHATLQAQDQALEQLAGASRTVLLVRQGGSQPVVRDHACQQRLVGPAGTSEVPIGGLPRAALCSHAWTLGLDQSQPEVDGVVRRSPLLLPAGGEDIVTGALAAAVAMLAQSTDDRQSGLRALLDRLPRQDAGVTILNRFYSARGGDPAFRKLSEAELLAGTAPSLAGQLVIIHRPAGRDSLATPVESAMAPGTLLATTVSNLLEQDYLLRPEWLRWMELGLLLLLAVWAAGFARRLTTLALALSAVTLSALLLGLGGWLTLSGQVWVQLVTPALFVPLALGLAAVSSRLAQRGEPAPATDIPAGLATTDEQSPEALDLAFSVLRQQPPSAATKQRLYNIAMDHGRRRDFARAERVLTHLASIDPGYRDVIYKLSKLSGARDEPGPPAPPAQPTAVRKPLSGSEQLGRYQLEGIIGRGAMATVYLGRDPMINRRVAIKTIPLAEEFSDSDLANARAQFMREAESAGRLNHPNIIAIYDAGEDGNTAYLAMEYFEGKPLSHHAQADRLLPPEVVLELVARAAEALHYAHTQRVVHRDIKPANLLYHLATDTLKLTDFGIARLTDSSRTRSGIILGTPSYMSPEQLSAAAVTGQSDLYSLGVTMYHLLTGAPPFQADSIPRLMEKIVHQRHRPVREQRDDLPAGVDAILDEALAKEPADRFPHGRAMALALRDCASRMTLSTGQGAGQ
ncbi:MAG: protein kinase [Chromatiales bacterium]|nr:protein kinase [Chromatiales bacterium]